MTSCGGGGGGIGGGVWGGGGWWGVGGGGGGCAGEGRGPPLGGDHQPHLAGRLVDHLVVEHDRTALVYLGRARIGVEDPHRARVVVARGGEDLVDHVHLRRVQH